MRRPCACVDLHESLGVFLESPKADEKIKKRIQDMIDVLKDNIFAGERIEKARIPHSYRKNYGINNLFRYDHPGGFRSCYTLLKDGDDVRPLILDMLTHKEYDRIFGYQTT